VYVLLWTGLNTLLAIASSYWSFIILSEIVLTLDLIIALKNALLAIFFSLMEASNSYFCRLSISCFSRGMSKLPQRSLPKLNNPKKLSFTLTPSVGNSYLSLGSIMFVLMMLYRDLLTEIPLELIVLMSLVIILNFSGSKSFILSFKNGCLTGIIL